MLKVIEMDGRTVVTSGAEWEDIVGYRRAVKRGNQIVVTGTVGVNEDGTFSEGIEAQTRRALDIVTGAVVALGGDISDIVRTRIYIVDVKDWEEAGKVHAKYFMDVRPATTMVQVAGLVAPEALIEIEADAIIV